MGHRARRARAAGILSWLRSNLWGTFGSQPYSPEANYSTVISPFVTGKEVDARFHAGDTKGAIDLIHLMWDQMVNENGPYYTGTVWEKLNQDGTDVDANASLAHGWGSGPVSSLSHYVRGRAAGDGGLQDVDRRSAARRAGVGAGHASDAARRARLALGPRRRATARSS